MRSCAQRSAQTVDCPYPETVLKSISQRNKIRTHATYLYGLSSKCLNLDQTVTYIFYKSTPEDRLIYSIVILNSHRIRYGVPPFWSFNLVSACASDSHRWSGCFLFSWSPCTSRRSVSQMILPSWQILLSPFSSAFGRTSPLAKGTFTIITFTNS